MAWLVEYTDEFGQWWDSLDEEEQEDVAAIVGGIGESGADAALSIFQRRQRVQTRPDAGTQSSEPGQTARIFYAFDPRRAAILLIGGHKTGKPRFYEEFIPKADRLYDVHMAGIESAIGEEKHGGGDIHFRN